MKTRPAELSKFEAEREFEKVWSRSVGNGQGNGYNRLRPALDGDELVAVSENGVLAVFSADEGERLWTRKLKLSISGGVGLAPGQILLGSRDGEVLALSREDGSELWRAPVSGEVLAPPQSDGRRVIAQTYDGHVVAFNSVDGKRLWAYKASVPRLTLRGTSTPAIVGDLVLVGLANGRLVALDAESGALRWEHRISVPQGSTEIERLVDVEGELLLRDDLVHVVGYQGQLVAIEVRSGRRLWERDASSYVGLAAGLRQYLCGWAATAVSMPTVTRGRKSAGVRTSWRAGVSVARRCSAVP